MKTLRALAAALPMGLPTALLAHALVFGSEHAAGGALQRVALALAALAIVVSATLRSRKAVQGSIAASRLRVGAPSLLALLFSAASWFAILELCESSHAIPVLALACALVAACVAVRAAVGLLARFIAGVTLALVQIFASGLCSVCVWSSMPRTASRPVHAFVVNAQLLPRPPPALS